MIDYLKPTFDDKETQERFKNDTIKMLSELPNERFILYWNNRLKCNDADTISAIYNEYCKRVKNGQL